MKVRVLHTGSSESSALLSGLAGAGLPVESCTLPHTQFDLSSPPPPGIYLNWIGPRAAGLSRPVIDIARQVLAWVQAKPVSPDEPPRTLINRAGAFELALSQLRQRTLLREAGIHVPRTTVVVGGVRELEGAARTMPAPFVVRANLPGSDRTAGLPTSTGAALFGDLGGFSDFVRGPLFTPSADGVTLLQEYVPPADGSLIRIRIAAGQFLYATRVPVALGAPGAHGLKRLNAASTSRESIIHDFDSPVIDRFIVFAARQGIEIASLDLAKDPGGRLVALGLSTTPEFPPHLESAARTPGLQVIAAMCLGILAAWPSVTVPRTEAGSLAA